MGHKATCILLMVLMLALNTLAEDEEDKCDMAPDERTNCGYPGVTAEECEKRSCCFKPYPAGFPWCFHPLALENTTEGAKEEGCSF